jgi:hypothetical protein
MGEPVSATAPTTAERGLTPFQWFGFAVLAGAAWALFMGLSYYNVPTFTTGALPTVGCVTVAVAAFLLIGWWAPPNE